jgi:hypothetical protein
MQLELVRYNIVSCIFTFDTNLDLARLQLVFLLNLALNLVTKNHDVAD